MVELEDLEVYKVAEEFSDAIWKIVSGWGRFAQDTLGRQVVPASDSIGANIAEGYGPYSFKENVQFCYYARGSLLETKHFLRRAHARNLLGDLESRTFMREFERLIRLLNGYIRSIRSQVIRPGVASRARVTSDD